MWLLCCHTCILIFCLTWSSNLEGKCWDSWLYLQRLSLCYVILRMKEFFIILKDLEKQENTNASNSRPSFLLLVLPTPEEQQRLQQYHPLTLHCNARASLMAFFSWLLIMQWINAQEHSSSKYCREQYHIWTGCNRSWCEPSRTEVSQCPYSLLLQRVNLLPGHVGPARNIYLLISWSWLAVWFNTIPQIGDGASRTGVCQKLLLWGATSPAFSTLAR